MHLLTTKRCCYVFSLRAGGLSFGYWFLLACIYQIVDTCRTVIESWEGIEQWLQPHGPLSRYPPYFIPINGTNRILLVLVLGLFDARKFNGWKVFGYRFLAN